MLCSTRNLTDYVFGRSKARGENSTRRIDFKMENLPNIVITYFVLHYFLNLEKIILMKIWLVKFNNNKRTWKKSK